MEFNQKPLLNLTTLAIVPQPKEGKKFGSFVLEKNQEYFTDVSPKQFVDRGCLFYGSSLRGRLEGTRAIFGVNRKAPIVIDPMLGMFFLPTTSPSSSECTWISHQHIERLEKVDSKRTIIHFQGGKQLTVNVSYRSLTNQVLRTAQYRHLLMERITKPQESD
ncbi:MULTISPECIES: competence protein ComK [Allobacillus]|uniref:Competence protein ComK n=1 Tax=Allobacillus halotolerans TaxID=570278 RepID=A0ABS6GRM1_9BACI|nr:MULTISPECIES: competence protein ComK [Allobacillus]MBU6081767.1 competence protein ComK [Allobacillus halotolerans]